MIFGVSVRLDCKLVKLVSLVRVGWVSDVVFMFFVNILVISYFDLEWLVIDRRKKRERLNCCLVIFFLCENFLMIVFCVCLFVFGLSMLLVNVEN